MNNFTLMCEKSEELQKLRGNEESWVNGDKYICYNKRHEGYTPAFFIVDGEDRPYDEMRGEITPIFLPSEGQMLTQITKKCEFGYSLIYGKDEDGYTHHCYIKDSLETQHFYGEDGFGEVLLLALHYIEWGKTWSETNKMWEVG